jgi:hypothetical protein
LFVVNLQERTLAVVLELLIPPAFFFLKFWDARIRNLKSIAL